MTEKKNNKTILVTKRELMDLVREVREGKGPAPERNKGVVARVPTKNLREAVRAVVLENLSAIQTVATMENERVFDGAVQHIMGGKPPEEAVTRLANAAVASSAIPPDQKDRAAQTMMKTLRSVVTRAAQGLSSPLPPDQAAKELKTILRRGVLQTLKGVGAPEQTPYAPPPGQER